MVRITLVKPNVMQKLEELNIITQLKVQNHRKTFEASSTTGLHCIGENKCNTEVGWNKHNNPTISSVTIETFMKQHQLLFYMECDFKNAKIRENLGVSYIAFWKTDLNEKMKFERVVLFRNGVT